MSVTELLDAIMDGRLSRMAVGIIVMGHAGWFEECETIDDVNEWAARFAMLFK